MTTWNHLADPFPYVDAVESIGEAVSAGDHYLIFMPPVDIAGWPDLLDISDFVVWLDQGSDEILRVTPPFWQYAQTLMTGAPVCGVIFMPKTVPKALAFAALGLPPIETKDLIICRPPEMAADEKVPVTRLLLEAIRCIDPKIADNIAAAARR